MKNGTNRGGWKQLTAKQRAFLDHYLARPCDQRNAAEAFRRAYSTKASPRHVARMAQKLLKNPKIAAVIAEAERRAAAAVEKAIDRYSATQARILAELARSAFANMLDYLRLQPDGTAVVDLSQLTRDQAAAISEVTVDEHRDAKGNTVRRVKLKLIDKRQSLVDLARIQGYIVERTELAGIGGGPIETKSEVTAFGRDLMEKGFLEIARRRAGAKPADEGASH